MKEKLNKNNKVKKIYIILIILLILIILTCTTFAIIYSQKNKEEVANKEIQTILKNEEIIEYGTSLSYENILEKLINVKELPEDTNIKIFIDNNKINETENYVFNKVGEVEIVVQTLNQNTNMQDQTTWKVQDTKKPILSGVENKEVVKGEKINNKFGISAKDEIDGELEVIIEGKIDTNKKGEYTLIAKAIDKNQNEVTQEFKVTVKEKDEKNNIAENTDNKNSSKTNSKTKTSNKSTSKDKNTSKKTTTKKTSTNKSSKNKTSSNLASTKAGRLTLAKAEAKKVVKKIIKSGMTKAQKGEAICNYITNNVATQTNQSTEAYKKNFGNEAYAALVLKIAACSGRCKAAVLLCNEAGLKCKHINKDQWTHQWLKVQIDDGSWVIMDPQIGLFGGSKYPLE